MTKPEAVTAQRSSIKMDQEQNLEFRRVGNRPMPTEVRHRLLGARVPALRVGLSSGRLDLVDQKALAERGFGPFDDTKGHRKLNAIALAEAVTTPSTTPHQQTTPKITTR